MSGLRIEEDPGLSLTANANNHTCATVSTLVRYACGVCLRNLEFKRENQMRCPRNPGALECD